MLCIKRDVGKYRYSPLPIDVYAVVEVNRYTFSECPLGHDVSASRLILISMFPTKLSLIFSVPSDIFSNSVLLL